MRSIFTLSGLLITVALIMWAFSRTSIPAAKQGEAARQDAQQISGRDNDGTPVAQTFALEAQSPSGKLKSLLVTSIDPGSAMERYYGLQKGDQITSIGELTVDAFNDGDTAIAMAQQAYQEKKALVVIRDGKEMTLAGSDAATPAPSPANPQQPGGIQVPGQ